jgi:hypothetical protein
MSGLVGFMGLLWETRGEPLPMLPWRMGPAEVSVAAPARVRRAVRRMIAIVRDDLWEVDGRGRKSVSGTEMWDERGCEQDDLPEIECR